MINYRLLLVGIAFLVMASCSPKQQEVVATRVSQSQSEDSDVINLHYNERPPYLMATEDGVEGLTGAPATLVFEKSNLPFQWLHTPSKRQIYILQQNEGLDCLVGWFKTAGRESYAKYTLPIYQDKPQIALARADNDKIPNAGTVEEIFSDSQLTLLVKDGYSYGGFLDQKIEEYDPVVVETTVENSGMLKMIYARHADYFIIAPEEADGLIDTSPEFYFKDFKSVHFTDIPAGENRYILCSFQVDDSTIEQLNVTIRQYLDVSIEE